VLLSFIDTTGIDFKCVIMNLVFEVCPQLDALMIPNGKINATSHTCGTSFHLTCDPGYTLVGDGVVRCGPSLTWSHASSCEINGMNIAQYYSYSKESFIHFIFMYLCQSLIKP